MKHFSIQNKSNLKQFRESALMEADLIKILNRVMFDLT